MTPPGKDNPSAARFASTHWSLVLTAGRGGGKESRDALAALCEAYWLPLYAYVRRRGHDVHDAQDLTQGFFARFLEKNYLGVATPEKGRFRSYLLGALEHFLSNERDRDRAAKRGGGQPVLSLDFDSGEARYSLEPRHDKTPERMFDRFWATTVLDRVLVLLEREFENAGKKNHFKRLRPFLTGDTGAAPYRKVARDLGLSEGAVKVAVHRMRRRYREILKGEIRETLADPGEVEDEIGHLLEVMSR